MSNSYSLDEYVSNFLDTILGSPLDTLPGESMGRALYRIRFKEQYACYVSYRKSKKIDIPHSLIVAIEKSFIHRIDRATQKFNDKEYEQAYIVFTAMVRDVGK